MTKPRGGPHDTGDIILHLFCRVDDRLPEIPKQPQALLYPSELVTVGILFCLKGGCFRAFYRWLKRDYGDWFGHGELPERTRLQRLLKTHQDWCELLMAEPSFFTVIDTYPIELIFPIREGRSQQQVGKKGRDKSRWTISSSRWRSDSKSGIFLDYALRCLISGISMPKIMNFRRRSQPGLWYMT